MSERPVVYHIPICPFCQRLEILLALKGLIGAVEFQVIDITKPREPWLLEKTGGTTALPVLETQDGKILKESLVILSYLEELFSKPPVRRSEIYERAVERMLIVKEGPFTTAGYLFVMNQDREKRQGHAERMLELYADLNNYLRQHNPEGTFLFDEFGLAEAVFSPIFMRFWFLEYYEEFELPSDQAYERVRRWRAACLAHPAAQQVKREQIIKLYYDYALGAGNGALPPGRTRSSFVFEPDWTERPWPPREKYNHQASDRELGLIG